MASLRKRGKVWYYRVVDSEGAKVERKGCPDRRATEELARAAESEAARMRAGLIDPKDEARRHHAARPLADHLADWHAAMLAAGTTAKRAGTALERARRVVALAGGAAFAAVAPPRRLGAEEHRAFMGRVVALTRAARLSDLDRVRVQGALASLKDGGYPSRASITTGPPPAPSRVGRGWTAGSPTVRWPG